MENSKHPLILGAQSVFSNDVKNRRPSTSVVKSDSLTQHTSMVRQLDEAEKSNPLLMVSLADLLRKNPVAPIILRRGQILNLDTDEFEVDNGALLNINITSYDTDIENLNPLTLPNGIITEGTITDSLGIAFRFENQNKEAAGSVIILNMLDHLGVLVKQYRALPDSNGVLEGIMWFFERKLAASYDPATGVVIAPTVGSPGRYVLNADGGCNFLAPGYIATVYPVLNVSEVSDNLMTFLVDPTYTWEAMSGELFIEFIKN